MGVLLQAFYRRGTRGVPSPADDAKATPWWWDHLAAQAHALRDVGFTALWLPPVNKGADGTASVGYDLYDDYDLGAKNQKGSIPTRYGTREQLARCVGMLRANGLDVYLDLVENQRAGGSRFVYRYKDAFGKSGKGRFPKDPNDFHPNVPQDPHVFGSPGKEISFGDDLAPINGKPKDYIFNGLIAGADWATRALDVQGYRLDDVKGISTDFLLPLLESKAMKGKFAVGEFFDGNVGLLQNWISNPRGMKDRASAFDFPTRFMLAQMCNQAGHFDMALLDHPGLVGADPLHAVTFVENHDTDASPNLAPIIIDKMLAYAFILTSEGYPCVFYKDYSTDPGCYNLKPHIDPLIWIHEKIADGPAQQRWKDLDVFAFERMGGAHLLVGLNKTGGPHTITVDTGFGPNVRLHDYTGHAGDVQTDGAGRVTLTLPANNNGLGYVCYSREGIGGGFDHTVHSVTQDYEGAADLDIPPAASAAPVQICRVWAEANTPLHGALTFDIADWPPQTSLRLTLQGPAGQPLGSHDFTADTPQGTALEAVAPARGFHTFAIQSFHTPRANAAPSYKLSVTYTAPQEGL